MATSARCTAAETPPAKVGVTRAEQGIGLEVTTVADARALPKIVAADHDSWFAVGHDLWMTWQPDGNLLAVHLIPETGVQCRACPRVVDVTSGNFHRIVTRDPLTLEASLICEACGWHGFVQEGRWVPA